MKRLWKYVLGVLAGTMFMGVTAFADEAVTVTQVDAVLYSNEYAVLYAEPDLNAAIVLDEAAFPDNLAIQVTGITSSGFFQVYLGETYYVPGYGLTEGGTIDTTEETEASETSTSDIVIDLGNGVTLAYPSVIDVYAESNGKYRGSLQILDIKSEYNERTGRTKLSFIYVPLSYSDDTTYGKQVAATITSYDANGFQVGKNYLIAYRATDAVGEALTYNVYIDSEAALIVISGS